MVIKVIGPGCARCKETAQVVAEAVRETGVAAAVEKVTDFKEIMALGVLSLPAVFIDDKIVCSGRVPSRSDVAGWIAASRQGASSGENA